MTFSLQHFWLLAEEVAAKNNMHEYFISSVFKYAESAEAPED